MFCSFQIVSLSQPEQEWLSNHLGHELHIDKDFYRQHDGIVEVAKISRILMMVASGKTADYAGKSLKDIGVEGMKGCIHPKFDVSALFQAWYIRRSHK